MKPLSYLFLRLGIALSMFGHGVVRIPKIQKFSEGMVASFSESLLPQFIVLPFSYALPIVELIIGIVLIFGFWTRLGLIAGCITMLILIFGTSLIENWGALPTQMIHLALFAILLNFVESDKYAFSTK